MNKLVHILMVSSVLFISGCSLTPENNERSNANEVDPRQGEEVQRVCNIDSWGQIDGNGKALIVYDSRRQAYKLSMIGLCDADWAMSRILIDGNSGNNCVGRGSKIATDANFARGGACTVMKVHQWLPKENKEQESEQEN